MTDAARHDGRRLCRLRDPHNTASAVSADAAYRSAAKVALLARRGLVPQFQRPKPRGRPMPPHLARGNASRGAGSGRDRARRRRAEVPGRPDRPLGRPARATARLGLANLVANTRLAWFATRAAPA